MGSVDFWDCLDERLIPVDVVPVGEVSACCAGQIRMKVLYRGPSFDGSLLRLLWR